ncbi:MAG: class I SAM-dependent methyltransferase, partial [Phenylobacterium sp.]|nr:class I SAM-dependent methyltransferase [Phenylobacterium sp.]
PRPVGPPPTPQTQADPSTSLTSQSLRRHRQGITIRGFRNSPPEGRVISLEASPDYAALARRNLDQAGLGDRVEICVGPALDTLARLAREGGPAFDLVFIDADKPNNPAYLDWALKLTRPGGLIIGDNVVRSGAVLDANSDDDRVRGVRTFTETLGREPRLFSTALQTVGEKGWDGMTLSVVEP